MKVVIIWIIGSEKTWWSINQWDEKDNQLYVYMYYDMVACKILTHFGNDNSCRGVLCISCFFSYFERSLKN